MATSTISTGSYRPGDAQNAWPLWTAVQRGASNDPGYVTTPPGNWLTPTRAIMKAGDLIGVKAACSEQCGTLSVEFSLNNGAILTVSNPTIQTDEWGTTEAYWFKLPAGLGNGLHEIRARIKPSISGNERLLQSAANTSLVSYLDQSTHSLLIAVDSRNYYAQVAVGGTASGSAGVDQGATPNAALPKYDSISAAHSALHAAMGGTNSSTAGATIYLGAGDWGVTTGYTPDDAYWLTIKGAPSVARADIRISVPYNNSGGDNPNLFNGYLKVQGVTLIQQPQYSLFYKPGSGANKLIWLDDFVYQGRGTTVGGGGVIANSSNTHPVTRGQVREVKGGHVSHMASGFVRNVDYYRNTGDIFTGAIFVVNSVVTECRGLGLGSVANPDDTEHADVYQNIGGLSNIILCNIKASAVKLSGTATAPFGNDAGVAAMQQVEGANSPQFVQRSRDCLFQNISLSGFEGAVGFMGGDPIGVLIHHCSFSNWFDLDSRTTTNGLSPTTGSGLAGTYKGCEIVNSIFYDMFYSIQSQSLVSKLKAVGAYRGNHLIAGSLTQQEYQTGANRSLADSTDTLGALTYNSGTLVPTNTTALSGRVAPAGILTDVLGNIRIQNNTTAGAFSTLLESGRLSAITVQTDSALDRITWTFDQAYQTGTFANGEPWVVGPVTITDIFPKPTDTPDIRRTTSLKHGLSVLQTAAQSKNVSDGLAWPFGPLQNSSNTVGGVGDVWHGSMINPEINSAYSSSGFDTRIFSGEVTGASDRRNKSGLYKHTLNAALSVCDGGPNNGAGFTLQPGDVLWSARSFVSTNPGDSGQTGTYGPACLQKIAVLTVLETAPPSGSFRPSIWGTDRTINWNIDDINWDVFKSLTLPPAAGADTTADFTYAQMLTMMPSLPRIEWADHALASYWGPWQNNRHTIEFPNTRSYSVPSNDNYPNGSWFSNDEAAAARGESYDIRSGISVEGGIFGEPTAVKFGWVALWLNTGPLTEEKKTIAYRYIQNGLDMFDWLFKYDVATATWSRRGYTGFAPNGGHRQGRKLPVVVAAACLGAKTGAATAKLKYAASEWKAVSGTRSYEGFAEDAAVFTINTGDIKRTLVKSVWGEPIPFELYNKSWLGKADWGITHSYKPDSDNAYQNSPYRGNQVLQNVWLACRLMDLTRLWNHDAATVLHFERWYSPSAGAQPLTYTDTSTFMYARMVRAYFNLFFIGRKIVTKQSTAVKSGANGGTTLATFTANKVGTIIAGPTNIAGVNWWQIRYKNGAALITELTGWSPETDINVLGAGFNTTIDNRGGIFEPGKAISLTTSVPDASVYYTTSTPGDTILTVTNFGTSAYVINGASNPPLSFVRGRRYIININAPGHPFWIQTVPGAYSPDAVYTTEPTNSDGTDEGRGTRTVTENNGTEVGTITIDVQYDAPQLYYVCGNHSSMAGSITVSDSTPADYDSSSGVAKLNAGGIPGTTSYSLPAGVDTVFSTAIVREGYDMSDVTSATYRIDSSGLPVQPSQSRGVASATQLEPALIFPPTATLTKNDVTWTFSESKQVGQYANGDWWVVGPVTITGVTPNTIRTTGSERHGMMVNPGNGDYTGSGVTPWHGFDSRIQWHEYKPTLNVTLPYTAAVNSSLVKSVSHVPDVPAGRSTGHPLYIKDYQILTVVAEAPVPFSFRPPYRGEGSRVSTWTKSDLKYDKLASRPKAQVLTYLPDKTNLEDIFSNVWFEYSGAWLGRYTHPFYMAPSGYGRDIANNTGDAALLLNLDYTSAEKERLLIGLVQYGIDNAGIIAQGGGWMADGGHNIGRLSPLIIAAFVLDNTALKNYTKGSAQNFQEYQQTFFVSEVDINRDGLVGSAGNDDFPVLYAPRDLGMPEWGIRHGSGFPTWDNNFWQASYRDINGGAFTAPAMAAKVMSARSYIDYEPFFKYAERHVDFERSTSYGGELSSNFTPGFHSQFHGAFNNAPLGYTAGSVAVAWSAAAGTVSEYRIYTKLAVDSTFTLAQTVASTARSTIITGLAFSTNYTVKVVAYNSSTQVETSVLSPYNRYTPPQYSPYRGAGVVSAWTKLLTNGSFDVTWSAASTTPSDYAVYVKRSGRPDDEYALYETVPSNVLSTTIKDRVFRTDYIIKVDARTAVTPATVPATYTSTTVLTTSALRAVEASNGNAIPIDIPTRPAAYPAPTGYKGYYRTGYGLTWNDGPKTTGSQLLFTGIEPNTQYQIKVASYFENPDSVNGVAQTISEGPDSNMVLCYATQSIITMPPGLTLNTVTGLISGTPTTAGTYPLTVSATNAAGTGSKALTITINPAAAAWSASSWSNDADSGIIGASTYTVAVNLGGGAVTVNGVPFQSSVTSGPNFLIGGAISSFVRASNVAGNSATLALDFIYGGDPRTVTLTGLTPGLTYETSLFSYGWEASGRVQTFASGNNTLTLDQDLYGINNGIRIVYTFVADNTGTKELTITPATDHTFHLAALANRLV